MKVHLALLVGLFAIAPILRAQTVHRIWGETGHAITLADSWQASPTAVADGTGGAMFFWTDGRTGDTVVYPNDIYGQHFDANGVALWQTDGIVVANANFDVWPYIGEPTTQDNAIAVSDGAGGAIIVWLDFRHQETDVFAQRIGPAGNLLWGPQGIPIAECPGWSAGGLCLNQRARPSIVSDGSGGAIIVWDEARDGFNMGVWAQHVNANGTVLWTINGILLGPGWFAQAVADGAGGAVVEWTNESVHHRFAQRVSSAGSLLWLEGGVDLGPLTGGRTNSHDMCPDGAGGGFFAWVDPANQGPLIPTSILVQRFSGADGHLLWGAPAVAFSAPNVMGAPFVIADGAGRALVAAADGTYPMKTHAQLVDANGNPLWTPSGISFNGGFDSAASDGSGGMVIASGLAALRVDSTGALPWGATPFAAVHDVVTTGGVFPYILSDGLGNAILFWADDRFGGATPNARSDLFAQELSQTRNASSATADLTVSIDQSPEVPIAGQPMTYTIEVQNLGPDPATLIALVGAIPLTDAIGAQQTTTTQGQCVNVPHGCNLGTLASGAFATVTVTGPAPLNPTASVNVESNQLDPNRSNNFASIGAAPTLTVTSPNGGEAWAPGSTHNITWAQPGYIGTDVKIELLKGGVLNKTVAAAAPGGGLGTVGIFSWLIPANQAVGSDYSVRITSNQAPQYTDTSDANFVIDQVHNLTVSISGTGSGQITSSPAGIDCGGICSASFRAGTVVTLTATPDWNSTFGGWSGACSADPCQVTMTADRSVVATFTQRPTTLTVNSPNGGESWALGSTHAIQWSYTGNLGAAVTIQLFKSGVLWSTLSSSAPLDLPNGAGSFTWTIDPALAVASDYKILVTSNFNTAIFDSSNANFSLTPIVNNITVISPNGGESWPLGSTQTITWSYAGNPGSQVKVELLKAGVLNTTISSGTSVGTSGSGSFSWAIPGNQTAGSDYKIRITSTANSGITDTSDANFTVGTPPTAVSVTPSSGSGTSQTFSFLFSDAGGANKITYIQALINGSFAWYHSCAVLYNQGSNRLYLVLDSGAGWQGPLTPGQAGTLSNNQCTLNAGASSVSAVGNNLTVNAALTFKTAFGGAKTVFLDAEDTPNSLSSGWQTLGSWTVPSAPTAVSVTPSSGSGTTQTFSFLFSDAGGASKITYAQALINGSFAWQSSCAVLYYQTTNRIYLVQDSGAGWQGPLTPGQAGTLSNSQCTLNAGASSVVAVGNNLTVNAALSFKAAFGGGKTVYLDAEDTPNKLSSGWQSRGTWTVPVAAPTAVSVTPSSGTGTSQTFALLYSDAGGAGKITYIQALINGSLSWQNACAVLYIQSSNRLYLVLDSGTGWQGPLTPGQAGALQNSQCTLDGGASSVSAVGNNLTVNAALTFKPAFAGNKTVFLDAEDTPGKLSSGWQSRGTWTVPVAAPTAVSVTPSSGSGMTQTFGLLYSDAGGASKITYVQALINGSLSWQNACAVLYIQGSNRLYLVLDSGTGWQGPLTPGQAGTLQNSQCTLDAGASSVSAVGNNLTVNAALTFKPAFTGSKTVYLDAEDTPGKLSSGWQSRGTWTVPVAAPTAVSVTPSSGSGTSQTFSFLFADADGVGKITYIQGLINGSFSWYRACAVLYYQSTNRIYLVLDSGTGWQGPLTPGQAGTLQNSQCTLDGGGSSVSAVGNNLTVNAALSFKPAFAGSKTVFLDAEDVPNKLSSGFQALGSWTVP